MTDFKFAVLYNELPPKPPWWRFVKRWRWKREKSKQVIGYVDLEEHSPISEDDALTITFGDHSFRGE